MNRINNHSEEMELNRIDHILASEEPLIPSSGFLASVMERVHEEATAPPPIPFPWKRAVPGMVLAAGVLGWSAFELVRYGLPAVGSIAQASPHLSAAFERPLEQVGWVALALGASLLSWLLSRRLVGRGGLL
ncbi:MAG: hypothetical protein ACLP7O_05035 [Terracidiphilus sp.]